MNRNTKYNELIRIIFVSFLASSILIIGCSAKNTSTDTDSRVSTNSANQISISENIKIEPREITLSDFSIINMDTGYIYSLFGDINAARGHLGIFTPEIIYNHPQNQDFSKLAQKWSQLYFEWLMGNGVILRIIVEGKGYETKRGVEVGDSLSLIDEVYGKDFGYRSKEKIEFDLGNAEYETIMALVFYLINDIVVKIEIAEGT